MAKWRIDRASIFLFVLGLLFVWDVAYYAGIRNPDLFLHPFRIFRLFGASDNFREFLGLLRLTILCFVPGGLIGIALASLVLHSSWLTHAMVRFLRLGLWLPFLLAFALPRAAFFLCIATAILCGCYHFLVARSLLKSEIYEAILETGRETFLQTFLICLISQIWLGWWKWFEFAAMFRPETGRETLIILVIFLFFINWVFRANFDLTAQKRASIATLELKNASWSSLLGAALITIVCLVIWQAVSQFSSYIFPTSALDALDAGRYLFQQKEILNDVKVSLGELAAGLALGGSLALLVFAGLKIINFLHRLLSRLLPVTYIAPIVLWLLLWIWPAVHIPNWLFWHKAVVVGLLTFFPIVQGLWGLRNHPLYVGVLLAIDDALPIAFVATMFGELWASTAGLGFMMVVASATGQTAKSLAGFLTTTILLVAFSAILRSIAKKLHFPEPSAETVPVEAT